MGTYYPNQVVRYAIGSAVSDVTLTDTFSDNTKIFSVGGFVELTLYVSYTATANNRQMSVQVEGGPDGVNFFPVAAVSDESPFTGEAITQDFIKKVISVDSQENKKRLVYPLADKYCRVSVKEDSPLNSGTASVIYLISGQ